ncbi:MAG: BlaI/MecI/CopY family transcriptional regulator [Acidobacteriia bacterium]|nr:BlaI/MecI/CopY family transcriptional regulator [Terriglobia bacterium]
MATRSRKLSPAEWKVMNLCWKLRKATARQIHEALWMHRERDYQTTKTLLDRIAAKGYLKMEKLGPLCIFSPAVSRASVVASAVEDFATTVLDNSVAPLFQHLAKNEAINERELEMLKDLLKKAEEKQK